MTFCASFLGFRIYFSHPTLSIGNPTPLPVEGFSRGACWQGLIFPNLYYQGCNLLSPVLHFTHNRTASINWPHSTADRDSGSLQSLKAQQEPVWQGCSPVHYLTRAERAHCQHFAPGLKNLTASVEKPPRRCY